MSFFSHLCRFLHFQIVVDHTLKIINCYTGWPGCVHDARVLRNSGLYYKAENGDMFLQNQFILGDNTYPLRNWLITPFKNLGTLTRQKLKFNKRLSSVRQHVERAFGHIKGRFRRLRDVPLYDHKDICTLIYAACILHNLCVQYTDDVYGYIEHVMMYIQIHFQTFTKMVMLELYDDYSWLTFLKEIKTTVTVSVVIYLSLFLTLQYVSNLH